jgi:hypothetical protein
MLISLLFQLLDLRAVKALDLRLAASRRVVHPCSATISVASSLAVISIPLVQKKPSGHYPCAGRAPFVCCGMNVGDNLLMGAYHQSDGRAAIRRDLDFVFGLFPRLYERRRQDASTLSSGEQTMCAIARGRHLNC